MILLNPGEGAELMDHLVREGLGVCVASFEYLVTESSSSERGGGKVFVRIPG